MKLPALLCLIALAAVPAIATPRFGITSSTIDGGGTRSPGPRFVLTGTIAQSDAAPASTGSRFAVSGGFWHSFTAVQTPEAPLLSFRPGAPGTVVLAWTINSKGWKLEENTSLNSATWQRVLTPVVDTATDHTVTVPNTAERKFFRLTKP